MNLKRREMAALIILLHGCLYLTSIVHGQDRLVDADKIKSVRGMRKNWQEDQCIVGNYSCEGLGCTYDTYSSPGIISMNFSSSTLIKKIAPAVSTLASINSSIGDDPNLCISGPCQKNKKMVIIQVIVAVISSAFFLLAITILWSFQRIKQHGTFQKHLTDRNSKALGWEEKILTAMERIVYQVCKKLPSRFARSQSLIKTIFWYIDQINKEALDFEKNCIDFVIEIPKNFITLCKTLIEASFRFTNEITIEAVLIEETRFINEITREAVLIEETSINIPLFMCEICVESKPKNESFNIKGCLHFYCTECIINYVASKLQENVTIIRCPVLNCEGLLDPEYCRAVLPLKLFERWGKALCESAILGTEKFYCPFKDCSMLLINDDGDPQATNHLTSSRRRGKGKAKWWSFVNQAKWKQNESKVITQSECPNCNRLFCAQCKVSWHSGFSCAEFMFHKKIRGREDELMKKLAEYKNWKRCPKCRFYVERSSGCMYMKCRCGFAFCYNCTAPSTSKSHICLKCKH